MAERLITVSKKQHDAINGSVQQIKELQRDLRAAVRYELLRLDETFGDIGIIDAVCRDGIYSLRIEVPDIAPALDSATPVPAEVMTG